MNLKDKLTIVIPCYNEQDYIDKTIDNLAKQINISGTKVIIADGFSKDKTRYKIINLKNKYKDVLDIEMVNGGKVAYARNYGANLVKTKYTLFMDADVVLLNDKIIDNSIYLMQHHHLDLMTSKIKSISNDIRAKLAFMLFNIVNIHISLKTPFAVGTFFLTRTDRFKQLKGFDETLQHSEDYMLSKQYNPKSFKISKYYIGQDDRRFKKMGYLGMIKLLIKGYINRNNIEFFKKNVGYW